MYRSSAAVNFFFFLLSKKPNKQTKKSIYFCRFLFLLAWACVCVPLVSRSRKWEEWRHDQLEPRVKNAQDGCSIRSDYFPDGWHSWNIWTRALTNCCVAVSGRLCAPVYFRWAFTSTSLAPGPFPPNYSSSSTDDVLRGREGYTKMNLTRCYSNWNTLGLRLSHWSFLSLIFFCLVTWEGFF